jgi:hypothetical protein
MGNGACAATASTAGKEKRMLRNLFSRENLYALLLCLVLIAVLILTSDSSPQWIYQGF